MEVFTEYCGPVILARAIESVAGDPGDDLYLRRMARRAKTVLRSFDRGQVDEAAALEELFAEIEQNARRAKWFENEPTEGRRMAAGRQRVG
jgi:hypothetical protein